RKLEFSRLGFWRDDIVDVPAFSVAAATTVAPPATGLVAGVKLKIKAAGIGRPGIIHNQKKKVRKRCDCGHPLQRSKVADAGEHVSPGAAVAGVGAIRIEDPGPMTHGNLI